MWAIRTLRSLRLKVGFAKESAVKRIGKLAAFFLTAFAVFAQTPAHKPTQAARPNTNAPTKVTGDGMKTTSGLQYWDIKIGTGEVATSGSRVKVHYTGWLDTGKKFDSTVDAVDDLRQPGTTGHGRHGAIRRRTAV